ncbi:DUF4041 domain-containing protein [Nitrospira sp. Nam74]
MDNLILVFAVLSLALGAIGAMYFKLLQKNALLVDDNERLTRELAKFKPIQDIQSELARLKGDVSATEQIATQLQARLSKYELDLDLHELGFYQPKFTFNDILHYVEALDLTREAQKELIKQKKVLIKSPVTQATPLSPRDVAKLAVSAFNGEVSAIIETVRYDNFERCRQQINTSVEKIDSLIAGTGYRIAEGYLQLKLKELALVYDYKELEQRAKEEQAELKAAMREEEKERAEAESAREKAIREQERYQAALEQARQEQAGKTAEERAQYEAKIMELQRKFEEATAERQRATAMAQITRKGHVYIISNIGSFGENVFKIGMTRRNDPKERIKELGDASVPFEFDIHALIMTDDAPALEASLHSQFEKGRINKVNLRKEFFHVALNDIAAACQKLGHTVTLTQLAEAREYRESQRQRLAENNGASSALQRV